MLTTIFAFVGLVFGAFVWAEQPPIAKPSAVPASTAPAAAAAPVQDAPAVSTQELFPGLYSIFYPSGEADVDGVSDNLKRAGYRIVTVEPVTGNKQAGTRIVLNLRDATEYDHLGIDLNKKPEAFALREGLIKGQDFERIKLAGQTPMWAIVSFGANSQSGQKMGDEWLQFSDAIRDLTISGLSPQAIRGQQGQTIDLRIDRDGRVALPSRGWVYYYVASLEDAYRLQNLRRTSLLRSVSLSEVEKAQETTQQPLYNGSNVRPTPYTEPSTQQQPYDPANANGGYSPEQGAYGPGYQQQAPQGAYGPGGFPQQMPQGAYGPGYRQQLPQGMFGPGYPQQGSQGGYGPGYPQQGSQGVYGPGYPQQLPQGTYGPGYSQNGFNPGYRMPYPNSYPQGVGPYNYGPFAR